MGYCKKWSGRTIAAALSVLVLPAALPAAVILTPAADAEIREDGPELTRGAGAPATGGGQTELAVRSTSNQNRWSIIRFDLTGVTVGDLGSLVDLQLHVRGNTWLNNQTGGVRVFGLNASAGPQLWNEQTVIYRDAGDAIPVSPAGGHPGSQPSVAGLTPTIDPPPAPVTLASFGSSAPSWNSDPLFADRAPGLGHENPPYSGAVETENAARFSRNQDRHSGLLGGAYEPYINQPGYTQSVINATYPDLVSMPLSTFNDTDSSPTSPNGTNTRFIGFLNFDALPAASRPQGFQFSFTLSPDASMASENGPNNTALIQYLTDLLNNGGTSATFLLGSKLAGDAGPVTGSNMLFASKDFWPVAVGAGAGPYSPKLVFDVPEPTSALALLGLAAAIGVRRRVR